jgi:voltage-gated potassium channel Kch
VLLSFGTQSQVFTSDIAKPLVVVVALSMAITPLLLILHERVILPKLKMPKFEPEPDDIQPGDNPIIIAGFGRFGMTVGRLLIANGVQPTVLDHDVRQIESLRRFGFKVFYGDASRPDLLEAAGCGNAKLLIVAVDDTDKAVAIVEAAKAHFPNIRILARAYDRRHAYEFLDRGVDDVFRETQGSAVEMGETALAALGYRAYRAHRSARAFKHHDERTLRDLAGVWQDEQTYILQSQQRAEDIQRLLQVDQAENYTEVDHAWEAPPVS